MPLSSRPLITVGTQRGSGLSHRTSAREFRKEVNRVQGGIAAFLEENNRTRPDRVIEHAYKEAWKKSRK